MTQAKQPMSWPVLTAILLLTGLAAGLTLGLLGEVLPIGNGVRTTGMGVIVGVVGVFLIQRRAKALAPGPREG